MILDSIKSRKNCTSFPPLWQQKLPRRPCQGWKCDSGHLEQLTHGSLTGPLRLLPNEKAQTSLDIFQVFFPLASNLNLGIDAIFAQVRRVFFFFK